MNPAGRQVPMSQELVWDSPWYKKPYTRCSSICTLYLTYFVFPFNLQEKLSSLKDICCSSGRNQNWTHLESDIILWSLTAWQGRWAPTVFTQQESKIGDSSFSLSMFPLGGLQKNRIFFFFFKKACLDWDLVGGFTKRAASKCNFSDL